MSPHPADTSPARHLELVAIDVAGLAAAEVRAAAGVASVRRTKSSPTDVVTATDEESEALIRAELLARCPGSTIVGEELDDAVGASNVGWIVDPIDGTVNFLYDLPVVSVSIAATIDGLVVAGAVADVHRREVFSATRGEGARRDGETIIASGIDRLDQALVGTGFAYAADLRAAQARVLHRLLPACRDIRCMGSAALNLCWVGCGRLDAYFERDLKVYDHAAGALIAAEGGAAVEAAEADDLDLTVAAARPIAAPLNAILRDSPD
ncbi:MAG: inositol monophosphatase family protein [Actinomycetota bacterium]